MSKSDAEPIEESSTDPEQTKQLSKKERLAQELESDTIEKGVPRISFRPDKTVAPNAALTEQYLSDAEAFSFIYLEGENTLVMIPLEEYDEDAHDEYPVQDYKDTSSSVSSRSVFHALSMDIEATHRYFPEWDSETGTVRIDLDEDPEIYAAGKNSE